MLLGTLLTLLKQGRLPQALGKACAGYSVTDVFAMGSTLALAVWLASTRLGLH